MSIARRGSARNKYNARHAYLSARPEAYVGVPGIRDDVDDDGRRKLEALRVTLHGLGLLGKSTPDMQREAIRRLVSELRGEHAPEIAW